MGKGFNEGDFSYKNLIHMIPKQNQLDLTSQQKKIIEGFLTVKIDLSIDTHCLNLN